MSNKKDKSLFGSFFNKDNTAMESTAQDNNKELLLCLHNLTAIGEGIDSKVDRELAKLKKMIKIGSAASELQNQVTIISKTLIATAAKPENDKLVKSFKKLPAEILIDEFIAQPISATVKIRLQNFRNTLTKDTLAITILADLITLVEPEISVESSTAESALEDKQLRHIANPMLQLFTQLEIPEEYEEEVNKLNIRAAKMTDYQQLSLLLEDVSQLVLSFIATSTGKFEAFLIQLKQRLDNVKDSIVKNQQTSIELIKFSDDFSECVTTQVDSIQSSMTESTDISQLENRISQSLETIVEGVRSFDSERETLQKEAADRILNLTKELEHTRSETNLLKDNLQQQRERALTDPLTKLPNRHAYNERLHLEYNRWRRYQKPLSLVMGDIDKFKQINDTYGHIAGDTALRETAKVFTSGLRETDFIARFGGEEFVIIMPETSLNEATKAINKLRKSIQENKIHEAAADFQLTISFGVASFEQDDTFESVILRADKAMYRAKSKGRNQVCVQRNSNQ